MIRRILPVILLLALTGCSSDMTPGEKGALAGAIVGAPLAVVGLDNLAFAASNVAGGSVAYIAKREASPEQRDAAKENARIYLEHGGGSNGSQASQPKSHKRKKEPAPATSHGPRYIAVETKKDFRTSAFAIKSVMIVDTSGGDIVGQDVYDLKTVPAPGTTATFDNIQALYVGSP